MISDDLMKSPIQKIGKVSIISKREEATMNKKFAAQREVMLHEQLTQPETGNTKAKKDKVIDYDAMPIGDRVLKKMHNQYNERQKEKCSKASLFA